MRSAPLRRTDRFARHFRHTAGGRGSLREILRRFFSRLYRRERKSFAKRERREGSVSLAAASDQGLRALGGAAGFACTMPNTVFAQSKGGFRPAGENGGLHPPSLPVSSHARERGPAVGTADKTKDLEKIQGLLGILKALFAKRSLRRVRAAARKNEGRQPGVSRGFLLPTPGRGWWRRAFCQCR